MGFGALRSLIRPLSGTLASRAAFSSTPAVTTAATTAAAAAAASFFAAPKPGLRFPTSGWFPWSQKVPRHFSIFAESSGFDRLTDTRYPKRRPLDRPRRKRASLKPPGQYSWVKYVPGQPIESDNPSQRSVKLRKEKKRRLQRRAFIKAEARKRKAQLQEAERKKAIARVERKMAAVAREREWAQRLAELQKLEEEKSMA